MINYLATRETDCYLCDKILRQFLTYFGVNNFASINSEPDQNNSTSVTALQDLPWKCQYRNKTKQIIIYCENSRIFRMAVKIQRFVPSTYSIPLMIFASSVFSPHPNTLTLIRLACLAIPLELPPTRDASDVPGRFMAQNRQNSTIHADIFNNFIN